MMPRLARFAAVAPNVTFDVSATLAPLDFETDPRDLAILRGPARGAGVRTEVLMEERLVVVAAPALLPCDGPLPEAEVARLPLLQQATRPNLWLDWFRNAGIDPIRLARGARMEQFGMVIAAARAGLGVALVPEVLAAPDLAAGTLRQAAARSMATATPYALHWPARSEDNAAFRAFRDWLRAAARP